MEEKKNISKNKTRVVGFPPYISCMPLRSDGSLCFAADPFRRPSGSEGKWAFWYVYMDFDWWLYLHIQGKPPKSVDKQSPIESLKLIIIITISDSLSDSVAKKCKSMWRREEEDTFRWRALAEELHTGNGGCRFHRDTFLFYGVRQSALLCRSWLSGSGNPRGILIIIHGQNEHNGRYADFVRQLTSCNFEVYAIDWIGHGGSDGLHGYIPSLDHVVADNGDFLENFKIENPRVPCFFFGHSTGGAVVLKDVIYSLEWESIAIMTRP